MIATLRDMNVGDQGRVAAIEINNGAYREQLIAMGLTRGTHFTLKRIAPLGESG